MAWTYDLFIDGAWTADEAVWLANDLIYGLGGGVASAWGRHGLEDFTEVKQLTWS